MVITSLDNSIVKSVGKLKDKKYRDERGEYLIEGYRSVKDSVPYLNDYTVILSASALEKYGKEFSNPTVVSDVVMRKLSDTTQTQGVLCVAKKPHNLPKFKHTYALFLDRIRDPGNMGTIIRTALATGFVEVYCYDCVDAYNPKVVRSAMSAVSRINLYEVTEEDFLSFKQNGYKFICADMDGEDIFSYNFADEKIALIIGNEANGVSDTLKAMSNVIVSLPMEEAESLNAGVCASIMMYQIKYGKSKK